MSGSTCGRRSIVDDIVPLQNKITPLSDGAGIEEVLCQGRFVQPDGTLTPLAVRFHSQPGAGVTASVSPPPTEPLKPLDDYAGKVLRARRRGLVYPYELVGTLTGAGGSLQELDLDDDGNLVPVDRAPDTSTPPASSSPTSLRRWRCTWGIRRIVLSGDPTKGLGAVAEPECSRIMAALDLAESERIPVEWFTLSSGARISMDSGTENMDWVGAALRRIVEFTQAGGEINVVVAGINVGAQPYWNAEATMLMHTHGILVMTPDSAMVLTGKQSLDFSGGVSAEDNFGIGGYDRVMGPQRPGPVLGAEPGRRDGHPARPLRPHLRRAGRGRAARRCDDRPVRPRRERLPAPRPRLRLLVGGPDLLGRVQPGPEEGLRHPHGHRVGV